MIISHKYKFIYFANPKTASTSIQNVLRDLNEKKTIVPALEKLEYQLRNTDPLITVQHRKHIFPRYVKQAVGEDVWNDYFKFIFVRNPWDWVLSNYNEKFCKAGSKKYNLGVFLNKLIGKPHPNLDLRKEKYFTQKDVYTYYNWVEKKTMKGLGNIFQYHYTEDHNGEQIVDFIGRYENLEHDLNQILSIIGLEERKLPLLNRTNKNSNYRNYYLEDSKSLVAEKYKKDIELFGYEF